MTADILVKDFFEEQKKSKTEIHQLTVYKNGRKIISAAPDPYTVYDKNHVYSLSKSFCSTAVGIACDLEYLSLDEKIVDIFPEKCVGEVSENMKKVTLSHVLSMNTGHEQCVMPDIMASSDPVASFISHAPKYTPGTHFAYNTAATYIASSCVTKRTGLTVLDFLEIHLFRDLSICGSTWLSNSGASEGGVGFHVSSDDAAKLGLLYLNGGVYGGKRYLSEEYVKKATGIVSDNSGNGSKDWCAGYGYQFWQNSGEGYRGDGAFGQLCMVFPKYGIVAAVIAETFDMQSEITLTSELAEKLFALDDGSVGYTDSSAVCDFYKPQTFSQSVFRHFGEFYKLDENAAGLSLIHIEKGENKDEIYLSISSSGTASYGGNNWQGNAVTGRSVTYTNRIKLSSGKWEKNILRGAYVRPTLVTLTAMEEEDFEFFADATVSENSICVTLRGTNCPHTVNYVFDFENEKLAFSRISRSNVPYNAEISGKLVK